MLVAAFSAASVDVRADGYLRCIGPAPLRFALAKPIHPQRVASFAIPDDTHPAEPALPTATSTTNPVQTATNDVVALVQSQAAITNSVSTPKADFVPADNMLTITPTMLTEYFKPGGGTNQAPAVVVLPEQMNFQPPIPKDTPSSSATYKSE